MRQLRPQVGDIAASREVVFGTVAAPHHSRRPKAIAEKVRVLERGSDMVLAARTPICGH